MNAHLMCDRDWHRLPDPKPIPVAVTFEPVTEAQPCCWCGEPTQSGVFFANHEPEVLACKGQGEIHQEEQSDSDTAGDTSQGVVGDSGEGGPA